MRKHLIALVSALAVLGTTPAQAATTLYTVRAGTVWAIDTTTAPAYYNSPGYQGTHIYFSLSSVCGSDARASLPFNVSPSDSGAGTPNYSGMLAIINSSRFTGHEFVVEFDTSTCRIVSVSFLS